MTEKKKKTNSASAQKRTTGNKKHVNAGKRRNRFPEIAEIEQELDRLGQQGKFRRTLYSTIGTLTVVAAIAVLVATLFLPVVQAKGVSMEADLHAAELIVGIKTSSFEVGQVCSFYFNNKLVLKRVIGTPGDWVNIDDEGRVYVNNVLLEEPYVQEYDKGICDIEFPYQVPDGRVFVLGDNRADSIDSRSTAVGSVEIAEIVGRIVWRVWPLDKIGSLRHI